MNNQLLKLKNIWASSDNVKASDRDILLFEKKYDLLIPDDLNEYFRLLNGTDGEYDKKFFQFYSLDQFKRIDERFKDWNGVPNYKNIVNTFKDQDSCFVFADFQIYLFSYAILLNKDKSNKNEVYAFCGDEYRIIAYSFTEFLDLYFSESIKLQF
jgi:hypothetical protein